MDLNATMMRRTPVADADIDSPNVHQDQVRTSAMLKMHYVMNIPFPSKSYYHLADSSTSLSAFSVSTSNAASRQKILELGNDHCSKI